MKLFKIIKVYPIDMENPSIVLVDCISIQDEIFEKGDIIQMNNNYGVVISNNKNIDNDTYLLHFTVKDTQFLETNIKIINPITRNQLTENRWIYSISMEDYLKKSDISAMISELNPEVCERIFDRNEKGCSKNISSYIEKENEYFIVEISRLEEMSDIFRIYKSKDKYEDDLIVRRFDKEMNLLKEMNFPREIWLGIAQHFLQHAIEESHSLIHKAKQII